MSPPVQTLLRSPGFCPEVRGDLAFERGRTAQHVAVTDPSTGRRIELHAFEHFVLQQMTGANDLDALTGHVRRRFSAANRAHVEKAVIRVADLGLLVNIPDGENLALPADAVRLSVIQGGQGHRPAVPPPFDRSSPVVSKRPIPVMSRPVVGYMPDDDAADFEGETAVDPRVAAAATSKGPSGTIVETPEALEQRLQELGPAPKGVGLGAPPPPPAFPAPAAPTPAAVPPPESGYSDDDEYEDEYEDDEPAAPAGEARAEPAYELESVPWYKVTRNRRLLYIGGFALVIAVLAILPWPLLVTEQCVIRPESQIVVRAPVEGVVAEVFVGEGDRVEKGAPLARLDDRDIAYQLRRAEAEHDRLSANLEKMEKGSRPEEIRSAQALVRQKAQEMRYARKELDRVSRLYKSGDVSQAARDGARRDYKVKMAALSEAGAQSRLVKAGFRIEEVEIAKANLRKAQADVEYYTKQRELLIIVAPISGRVLTPRFSERIHEKVALGDAIVELGDAVRVRVEIMVPEREVDVVAIGQPVEVKVHSFPLQPFYGKVTFIAPAVEEAEGRRFIRVDAIIDNDEEILQPRMTGYAEIDAGNRSVLTRISRRAIRWFRVRFLI